MQLGVALRGFSGSQQHDRVLVARDMRPGRLSSGNVTSLPTRLEYPSDGGLAASVSIADHQLHTGQAARLQSAQELHPKCPHLRGAGAKPYDLTPTVITATMLTMRPPCRTFRYVALSQTYGQSPLSGQLRNSPTHLSMPLQSFETVLFEVPPKPIACTSSSPPAHRDASDPSLLCKGDERLLGGMSRLDSAPEAGVERPFTTSIVPVRAALGGLVAPACRPHLGRPSPW